MKSFAYVVLHTPAHRIVAIAYDRRLAVRLGASGQAEAIGAGNTLVHADAVGQEH